MDFITRALVKLGILRQDLDYHLIRTSMVVIFLFFGYQKWFDYEAQALIPYISHGPLIFWLYKVFGVRGACWFLGVAEWFFCILLFGGFWNKRLGILGALGGIVSFLSTITIIPFIPNGGPSAGVSRDDGDRCVPSRTRPPGGVHLSVAPDVVRLLRTGARD
jgi:uncharacterized membrane protein YkgB